MKCRLPPAPAAQASEPSRSCPTHPSRPILPIATDPPSSSRVYADTFGLPDIHGGNFDAYLRYGGQITYLDPLTILPVMARVTRHLGLGATLSTTLLPPYWIARTLASLDLLTGGRAAWNVVTSATSSEARNFGMDGIPPRRSGAPARRRPRGRRRQRAGRTPPPPRAGRSCSAPSIGSPVAATSTAAGCLIEPGRSPVEADGLPAADRPGRGAGRGGQGVGVPRRFAPRRGGIASGWRDLGRQVLDAAAGRAMRHASSLPPPRAGPVRLTPRLDGCQPEASPIGLLAR